MSRPRARWSRLMRATMVMATGSAGRTATWSRRSIGKLAHAFTREYRPIAAGCVSRSRTTLTARTGREAQILPHDPHGRKNVEVPEANAYRGILVIAL